MLLSFESQTSAGDLKGEPPQEQKITKALEKEELEEEEVEMEREMKMKTPLGHQRRQMLPTKKKMMMTVRKVTNLGD